MKTCCYCKAQKELSEFHKNRSESDGLHHECKACVKRWPLKTGEDGLNSRQRRAAKNPGGAATLQRKHKYGISSAEYEAMLDAQGGACAICNGIKRLGVDHDHATGKVRAVLCRKCNAAIGLLKDSSKLATAAADFLIKHGK